MLFRSTGVRGLHADGVLVPGLDDDLAAEVVDVETRPGPDRHGRIGLLGHCQRDDGRDVQKHDVYPPRSWPVPARWPAAGAPTCAAWCRRGVEDRKSTRLNSSHSQISYAVFCLKKTTHARA